MSPPSKLQGISPTQFTVEDSGESTVPLLPDDVMLMIFDELTMEERAVIGTTCKRFRELDFEQGKKTFDSIEIDMSYNTVSIHAKSPTTEYYLLDRPFSAILQGYHNQRLFRNAKIDSLRIKHTRSLRCKLDFFSTFIKNVSFKILNVDINCNQNCIDTYIRSLLQNCNFDENVTFCLKLTNSYFLTDASRTRDLIMQQFPRLDNFCLNWKLYELTPLIDNSTLLNIISNTNHAVLGNSQCTTQGILEAFEMVRKSVDYKCVTFKVPQSSADMFFTTHHHNVKIGSKSPTSRYAYDRRTRTILWATSREGSKTVVIIGKTEEHKTILRNPKWI